MEFELLMDNSFQLKHGVPAYLLCEKLKVQRAQLSNLLCEEQGVKRTHYITKYTEECTKPTSLSLVIKEEYRGHSTH